VAQLAAAVKSDEAIIENAQVLLGYTRITTPIEGVLGVRQLDVGKIMHPTDPSGLVVVTQLQPISVIFGATYPYFGRGASSDFTLARTASTAGPVGSALAQTPSANASTSAIAMSVFRIVSRGACRVLPEQAFRSPFRSPGAAAWRDSAPGCAGAAAAR
jgi:multidrug efflux pump subunit AcrA (membrane-fusion protein)